MPLFSSTIEDLRRFIATLNTGKRCNIGIGKMPAFNVYYLKYTSGILFDLLYTTNTTFSWFKVIFKLI